LQYHVLVYSIWQLRPMRYVKLQRMHLENVLGKQNVNCVLHASSSGEGPWWVCANTIIHLRVPYKARNFFISWVTISFSRTLLRGATYLLGYVYSPYAYKNLMTGLVQFQTQLSWILSAIPHHMTCVPNKCLCKVELTKWGDQKLILCWIINLPTDVGYWKCV